MSQTARQLPTGSGFLGTATEYNGCIINSQHILDYVNLNAYTGASLGTGLFKVNLYDATNSNGQSFIDLSMASGESETFTLNKRIHNALHGVFTGSGSLTATYR